MSGPVEGAHETIREIAATIAPDFVGVVPTETVEILVAESYARLNETARIPTFVPLLTQRFARERLREVTGGFASGGAGESGHQHDA